MESGELSSGINLVNFMFSCTCVFAMYTYMLYNKWTKLNNQLIQHKYILTMSALCLTFESQSGSTHY